MMRLSIVIPTLNESEVMEHNLARAWALAPLEVIVVDGGSDDATLELARAGASVVLCCRPGRGFQLNRGARYASGDVLLFLHADTWLEPAARGQLSRALDRSGVQWGAFAQRIDSPATAFRLLEYGNRFRARCLGLPYGDQALFVRRGLFVRAGGYPPARIMEDVQLSRRLCRYARPVLLPGPLHVSARRWQRHGVARQTIRNWSLLTAYLWGIHPDQLARWYPPTREASR